MNEQVPLFPEQASVHAGQTDQLYWFLVLNAFFFPALICLIIVFFVVRYRRGSNVNRESAPTFYMPLEILWSFIPLTVGLISFGWGAKLYVQSHQPPDNTLDIYVVGKQWMWKVQHAEGRREINELHVPTGQPVRLRMISEDVIHSFFVPAFRLKQDVLPGRYTDMWFEASKTGEYHLFCAEYCGTSHSLMRGTVVVQTPQEYAEWLASEQAEEPHVAGRRLYDALRCGHCHDANVPNRAPALNNLFGRPVVLESGETVTADLEYVRRSILDPATHVVRGYPNQMPSYRGQLSEEELLKLLAYLRTL
jgi:cytochrome c oxidase subunit 2